MHLEIIDYARRTPPGSRVLRVSRKNAVFISHKPRAAFFLFFFCYSDVKGLFLGSKILLAARSLINDHGAFSSPMCEDVNVD